jgi:hypothetical protein
MSEQSEERAIEQGHECAISAAQRRKRSTHTDEVQTEKKG